MASFVSCLHLTPGDVLERMHIFRFFIALSEKKLESDIPPSKLHNDHKNATMEYFNLLQITLFFMMHFNIPAFTMKNK